MLVRGERLLIVFDAARPLDLDAVRRLAPGFGGAHAEAARGITELHVPLAAAEAVALRLLASEGIWSLATGGEAGEGPDEIGVSQSDAAPPRLLMPASEPGRVVTLRDPATDGLLLIGTSGARRPFALTRPDHAPHADGLELLPTRLGVAVHPRHDDVALRLARDGFAVTLPRTPVENAHSGALTIPALLDLPDLPREELLERRRMALAAAGAAAPQARGALRLAQAEALLALGLGAEAQSLVALAVEDDPRLATSPRALLLLGAAPLVAGRIGEAATALADPRLNAEREALLWRALSRAEAGETPGPADAAALADAAPNLARYPMPLRGRLVPLAATALVEAGQLLAAQRLLQDRDIQGLSQVALAQARVLEAQGRREPALAAYAMLSRSRHALVRTQAMERGAELRFATGSEDARRTATAIEGAAAAWRGDARELALRLRAATLWREAGDHSTALALLGDTAVLFPESSERVRALMTSTLRPALVDPDRQSEAALRLVTRHPEALPATAHAVAALSRLAERAAEARQPAQSAAALRLAMARTDEPRVRADLALRLAVALLAGERPAEAEAALRDAPVDALTPAQRTERTQIQAEAARRRGDATGAATLLGGLGAAALPELAEALAARRDWAGASDALGRHAAATIPPAPAPLDGDQREMVLRLASFASLARDEPRLAALREAFTARLADGPLSQAFATLVGAYSNASSTEAAATSTRLARVRDDLEAARRLQEEARQTR